jgi:hypothetical protein
LIWSDTFWGSLDKNDDGQRVMQALYFLAGTNLFFRKVIPCEKYAKDLALLSRLDLKPVGCK